VKSFKKKDFFYRKIIPDLISFAQEKSSTQVIQNLKSIFPTCYHASWENPLKFILLEDMCSRGYEVKDIKKDLDLKHSFLVLSRIARFHAVSFAFKGGDPTKLRAYYGDYLVELYEKLRGLLLQMYDQGLPGSLNLLHSVPGYVNKTGYVQRVLSKITDFWNEKLSPSEPLALLCHGDLWTCNLLWKYEEGNAVDVKIIDLQVIRYGNPSLDISNFLCICVDASILREHFDTLLGHYHHHFVETLSELGYPTSEVTLDALHRDYSRYGQWGLICALEFLPLMLSKHERTQNFMNDLEKSKDNADNDHLKNRICGLIDFYFERGWIQ